MFDRLRLTQRVRNSFREGVLRKSSCMPAISRDVRVRRRRPAVTASNDGNRTGIGRLPAVKNGISAYRKNTKDFLLESDDKDERVNESYERTKIRACRHRFPILGCAPRFPGIAVFVTTSRFRDGICVIACYVSRSPAAKEIEKKSRKNIRERRGRFAPSPPK